MSVGPELEGSGIPPSSASMKYPLNPATAFPCSSKLSSFVQVMTPQPPEETSFALLGLFYHDRVFSEILLLSSIL